ncbi:MAG: hypothetical protein R2764_00830 [Bacteroidales bacterium]
MTRQVLPYGMLCQFFCSQKIISNFIYIDRVFSSGIGYVFIKSMYPKIINPTDSITGIDFQKAFSGTTDNVTSFHTT